MNLEKYERQMALIDLYGKLAVAEQQIADRTEGKDFSSVAKQIRFGGSCTAAEITNSYYETEAALTSVGAVSSARSQKTR